MRVIVDDAEIDVVSEGSGDAVVLLHGFPLTREIWNAQASHLAKTHRVIRPDLRGMGRSNAPYGPYLMETLAGDVAAVLDALSIDRAAIVGHSLGGYVALAFARMYTERLTRLALVCSRLRADDPNAAIARNELADRMEEEDALEPAIEAYVPVLFAPETFAADRPLVDGAAAVARENSVRGSAGILRGMAQRAASDDMAGDLDVPVLVVAGRLDQVVSLKEAEEIAEAFPQGRLEVMERSGHLPMLEEPERLGEVLAAFL